MGSLYKEASSTIKVNGILGPDFPFERSVRQGCPLAPYLFILAIDVLGYLMANPKFEVEGLSLPQGGIIRDQTFADDTALYLKGTPENLDKAQRILTLFSQASGAKVNWHKMAAIWANKSERTWSWGEEVGLRWLPKGSGTRYLGIHVGFHLPPETNFEKMMFALKSKLITWSNNRLSLVGRILVANQVLLASIWYLAACWNPNPLMCARVRGLIRNFIWGGKDAPARAKVRWDTLVLPASQGGLGIIDPKSQSEALLAKLLIRGLAPGGEPWKELIRRYADQVRLPIRGKGPPTPDINWLFAAPKLKRPGPSMWKSILGSWLSVRPGLTKSNPTSAAEILRQPIFGNPSVLNTRGIPLGLGGTRDGNAFANHGYTIVKDLWCNEEKDWKSLAELEMCYHENNRKCKEEIAESIP